MTVGILIVCFIMLYADENECSASSGAVCGLALCINTRGSYDCQCGGGHNFDLNLMSCVG